MGWTLLLSQSVLKGDSCILNGCELEEKKTCGCCGGYSGRCVVLCIPSSLLFSEFGLKGISTSLLFTVTGHGEGGSGLNSTLANQYGHVQLKQVVGVLMKGEHMQFGTG